MAIKKDRLLEKSKVFKIPKLSKLTKFTEIDKLKKLFSSNKNIKFNKDYIKVMTHVNVEAIETYNYFNICISGLQSLFCDLCTLYNTVLEEVIENMSDPHISDISQIVTPDVQDYVSGISDMIFKTQIYTPLYTNICDIETQLDNFINDETKYHDDEISENIRSKLYNIRFNMEEFERFLEDKPFGYINFELEEGFED